MGIIPLDDKIFHLPPINAPTRFPCDLQLRERPRLPRQLHLQGIDVVNVYMCVPHCVSERPGDEIANVSQHMGQQRITRDVKRHTQSHIAAALVQLAVQSPLNLLTLLLRLRERHVELRKHMTRREGHELQIFGVPGAQNDPAIVRVVLQLVNDLRELIDPLARIVRLGIDVLGAEMAPLEAVHGAQVADGAVRQADGVEVLTRSVAVPDLDARFREGQRGRRARHEPEQLGDHGAQEDALGGEEG